MNAAERAVARLAETQFGVATKAQALDCGMSDRTLYRRQWDEVFPSVFALPGTPRTGRQRAMAATLWGGTESLISHTTAGRLLRLDDITAEAIHLLLPLTSGLRHEDITLHRTGTLIRTDRVVVDGIPCTSATRTIIDCATVLDGEALEVAFESARRMGLTSVGALQRRADALCGRGRPGSAAINALLAHQDPRARPLEYKLEVKTARLLRSSRLPSPTRQHWVGQYRLDFAWPAVKYAVECDGFYAHGYRLAWKRDRRRIAQLEAAGWSITFVTWDDVTRHADETLSRIALRMRAVA